MLGMGELRDLQSNTFYVLKSENRLSKDCFNVAGCEYGDRNDKCKSLPPNICYNNEEICCETCAKIKKQNSKGKRNVACQYS